MIQDSLDWYERLSPKEREVLETYAREHSYEAVARALKKSESVVDQQLLSARRKMGVSSTAEAMFRLAERQAMGSEVAAPSSGTNEIEGAALNSRPEDLIATKRSGSVILRALWITILLSGSLIGIAIGSSFLSLGHRPSGRQNAAGVPPLSPRDLSARIQDMRGSQTGDLDQHKRAALIATLCDLSWDAMWGPSEDDTRDAMAEVAPDIHSAFEWAVVHEPNTAVRIVGNGHRVFSRIPALSDWGKMLDRALANKSASHGREYGRALCGVALAHWKDDPARGAQAAHAAYTIFDSLPVTDWDRANALRHEGLCTVGRSRTAGLAMYSRALAIYDRLGDARGRAQTMLSMGQAGSSLPDPSAEMAERVRSDIQAAKEFRRLRNDYGLNACIAEIDMAESKVPSSREFLPLRRSIRIELSLAAQDQAQAHMERQEMDLLTHCLKLDCDLHNSSQIADDIESLLMGRYDVTLGRHAVAQMFGYYRALCRRAGRPVNASLKANRFVAKDVRFGERMTSRQMILAATQLVSPLGDSARTAH